MDLSNLELITTQTLLEELSSRFEHFIFAGIKDYDKDGEVETRRHHGGWRTCQGLAVGLIAALEEARKEDIQPMDEGDC
jgi:hypothetical protein